MCLRVQHALNSNNEGVNGVRMDSGTMFKSSMVFTNKVNSLLTLPFFSNLKMCEPGRGVLLC